MMGNVLANAIENDYSISCPCFLRYSMDFEVGLKDALMRYPEVPQGAQWDKAKRRRLERWIELAAKAKLLKDGRKILGHYVLDVDQHFDKETQHYTLSLPAFAELRKEHPSIWLMGYRARDKHALFRQPKAVNHFFRPRPDIVNEVDEFFQAHFADRNGPIVGMHIRRGDYAGWIGGKYFYSFEQYRMLAEQALAVAGPNARLLICSNETPPQGVFEGLPVVPGPGGPMTDLYALARCDLLLGPPSTFSSWASYQNDIPLYHIHDANNPMTSEDFMKPYWENTP